MVERVDAFVCRWCGQLSIFDAVDADADTCPACLDWLDKEQTPDPTLDVDRTPKCSTEGCRKRAQDGTTECRQCRASTTARHHGGLF